jgi:hypothetical protein
MFAGTFLFSPPANKTYHLVNVNALRRFRGHCQTPHERGARFELDPLPQMPGSSLPRSSRARYFPVLEQSLHQFQEPALRLPFPALPPRQRAWVHAKALGGLLLRKPEPRALANPAYLVGIGAPTPNALLTRPQGIWAVRVGWAGVLVLHTGGPTVQAGSAAPTWARCARTARQRRNRKPIPVTVWQSSFILSPVVICTGARADIH